MNAHQNEKAANPQQRAPMPGAASVNAAALKGWGANSSESLLETFPCVVPGKPGFEKGQIYTGKYLLSKLVVSAKLMNESGTRILHVFQTNAGEKFGIWGTGSLDAALSRTQRGTELAIEYTGIAEKPLKRGQTAPHTFRYYLPNGKKFVVDFTRKPIVDEAQGDVTHLVDDAAAETE